MIVIVMIKKIESSFIISIDILFIIGFIYVIKIVFEKYKMNELYIYIMFFFIVVKVYV